MSIYLDNNGTTPLKPYVKKVILNNIDVFGNPSSAHSEGQTSRMALDHARRVVANCVSVRGEQVVFTASGTESNVMALRGIISICPHKRLITSPTEHSSVYSTAVSLAEDRVDVVYLPVNNAGVICLTALEEELKAKPTSLVSIMAANNETGVKQPIEEIAKLCNTYNTKCHIDAVQLLAKEAIHFPSLNVDALTLSFHKIGGPKGCGALILKNELKMSPLITGGGQERFRRSGTENILGIIASGAACEKVNESIEDMPRLEALRTILEEGIQAITPDAIIVGTETPNLRLPVTTSVIIPGTSAETVLMSLDMAGICISQGSACSSGKSVPSRVLTSQGYTEEEALAGLRISMAWHNTKADVETFLKEFKTIIERLR